MSKETAAKLAVRDTLVKLVEANQTFKKAVLADSHLPAWVMRDETSDSDTQKTDRELAAETTTRLTYQPNQSKQETARLPGLIGISPETYQCGLRLNTSRVEFKQAMGEYRKLFGDSIEAIEQTSEELREGILGGLKIHHIHFVQSYRQLKLFAKPPRRVGFSWAASHSGTVRLSAPEAIDHLRKKYLASGAIGSDIQVLEQMPEDQIVVIKRILAPHLRANLTWSKTITALRLKEPENKKRYPGQINTPLPLFLTLAPGEPLPEFNRIRPFDPLAKQERLQRSDARLVKISDNPHSRIYRYESAEVSDG
ncbi:DNA replication terminus site-binding protein [Endozoicomonas sp. Mp262]|uniref:DNA replication terminus site-binding protein n=1 Tax=Endozoicomonas sp. Mp262 TaxID=2919499 RepID=UPI0021DA1936